MMRCPLPIDWLEYLEGAGSGNLASHIRECRPCQILVEELRREQADHVRLRAARLPTGELWPHWHETKSAPPALGEIWWSARSLGVAGTATPRIPLLVTSDAWQEAGRSWFEVMPLSTDIESATSLDLVLVRDDTDLAVPWRVFLRHQTVAERDDLEARIGRLTEAGETLLRDVVSGAASEDRFGSPIEGPADQRVILSEDIESVIRLVGQSYARMLEGIETGESTGHILTSELRQPMVREVPRENLKLAAEAVIAEEDKLWVLEIPERGCIRGRFEYRLSYDELCFAIEEVAEEQLGLKIPVCIVFWAQQRLSAPVTSEPFVPQARQQVFLGRDKGVFPREISRVEVKLAHED